MMQRYELRIRCKDKVKSYGTVEVTKGQFVSSTPEFKVLKEVAKACIHGNLKSNKGGCCKVESVDISSDEYIKDIETPCESSLTTAKKKQRDQSLANLAFGLMIIFSLLLVASIFGMIADGMDDAVTFFIIFVAYLSFSMSLFGDTLGEAGKRLKTITSLAVFIVALDRLGLGFWQ
ncbi:hypothetical protein [Vibrio parahaemolyticus]|uniref:hypothetical protein n=1 Tax=Vibrio parahaemolyticus TaxID=670 RepID=UPI0011212062|nr:hypothetical protein [Vibrio parahaemolyticus]MBE5194979.1 hypothetical protein [Vibrio parahaemolyticus]TOH29108.1 hypothetical protein CGI83_13195 [Vibrio parahaemolyticus]HCG9145150.1 hypothetical protein [Vibrio parahaemolyticus]